MTSQNTSPNDKAAEKAARRQRILIAVGLFAVSLFMYVSFILKTAIKGP